MINLKRELWRYEWGLVSGVLLEALLTAEVNRLVTLFRQEEARWWPIAQPGRKEFALRASFGQQIDAARAAIPRGALRLGWKHVEAAERSLLELLAAVAAEDDIKETETLQRSIPTDIAEARAGVAAITEAAKRLLRRAKEEQHQGNFEVAKYMARHAREQIASASASDLAHRMRSIRDADARLCARFPTVPTHMRFVEALTVTESLVEQQQLGVAVQLCNDLEEELRARTSFLRELESQGEAMPEGHPGGLTAALVQCGRLPGESWQSALHRLLHSQLQRVSARIRTLNAAQTEAGVPMEVVNHESA